MTNSNSVSNRPPFQIVSGTHKTSSHALDLSSSLRRHDEYGKSSAAAWLLLTQPGWSQINPPGPTASTKCRRLSRFVASCGHLPRPAQFSIIPMGGPQQRQPARAVSQASLSRPLCCFELNAFGYELRKAIWVTGFAKNSPTLYCRFAILQKTPPRHIADGAGRCLRLEWAVRARSPGDLAECEVHLVTHQSIDC